MRFRPEKSRCGFAVGFILRGGSARVSLLCAATAGAGAQASIETTPIASSSSSTDVATRGTREICTIEPSSREGGCRSPGMPLTRRP